MAAAITSSIHNIQKQSRSWPKIKYTMYAKKKYLWYSTRWANCDDMGEWGLTEWGSLGHPEKTFAWWLLMTIFFLGTCLFFFSPQCFQRFFSLGQQKMSLCDDSATKNKILEQSKLRTMQMTQKTFTNQRTEGPESRTDGETLIFWD